MTRHSSHTSIQAQAEVNSLSTDTRATTSAPATAPIVPMQPAPAPTPIAPSTCWKYALEAIIKLLFYISLYHDKCLLFMLELY